MQAQTARPNLVRFSAVRHLRALTEMLKTDFDQPPGSWKKNGPVRELAALPGLLVLGAGLARVIARNRPWTGFVWHENGEIIGNISIHPYGEERGCWEIEHVGVVRSHRKSGMGRVLMHAALRDIAARGGNCAMLLVFDDNTPAVRLYESLGFQYVKGSEGQPRHERVWMRRPVTPADLRLGYESS